MECRICQGTGKYFDKLLSGVCECSGTQQYVHYSCLWKWRNSNESNIRKCKTCKTDYKLKNEPFHTMYEFRFNILAFIRSVFMIVVYFYASHWWSFTIGHILASMLSYAWYNYLFDYYQWDNCYYIRYAIDLNTRYVEKGTASYLDFVFEITTRKNLFYHSVQFLYEY